MIYDHQNPTPDLGLLTSVSLQLRTRTTGTREARNAAAAMGCPSTEEHIITYQSEGISRQGYAGYMRHEWEIGQLVDSVVLAHARLAATRKLGFDAVHGWPNAGSNGPSETGPWQANQLVGLPTDTLLVLFGDYVPMIYSTRFVYIRTSGAASGWDINQDQSKNDILAIVPRTSGYGTMQSLQETYFQSGIFSVIDNLNSMKTLQLRLTDENGELIKFHKPFRLGIMVQPCEGRVQQRLTKENKSGSYNNSGRDNN